MWSAEGSGRDQTGLTKFVCVCAKQTAKQTAGAGERACNVKARRVHRGELVPIHLFTQIPAGTAVWQPYKVNILLWLLCAN